MRGTFFLHDFFSILPYAYLVLGIMRPGDITLDEYCSLMKRVIGSEDRTRNQLTDNVINKGK